jgi:hypothetical protein
MPEDWFTQTLVPTLIVAAILLLVLWPTRKSGGRLLRSWGVDEPTEPQAAEAVRYLRHRRVLLIVLFLAGSPLLGLVLPAGGFFLPLLLAMLVAELVATLRPVSGVRVASLDPRTWRDLLPRWAIGLGYVFTALAVGAAGIGVVLQPRDGATWLLLGGVAVCVAAVVGLVHLAVQRPASADEVVDAALRTRTARVAVAIGFGWLGTLASRAYLPLTRPNSPVSQYWLDMFEYVTTITLLAAIVAWIWLAVPTRRSLARAG